MTTKAEIAEWFDAGLEMQAHHMIVMVDEFDFEDYPIYVGGEQSDYILYDSIEKALTHIYNTKMQRVMEVYSMELDMDEQLAETRAYHID